ncbi:sensor domain-containing diguanylate cyclase [Planobispora longispora]|uniref:sensor domain-containing diguanylate cyclase n=1 Tax=Planobispora longispora TaxID=28887 RepID=UPI001942EC8C|nr:GGDEF domain-containing protein [Planobispora longispora]
MNGPLADKVPGRTSRTPAPGDSSRSTSDSPAGALTVEAICAELDTLESASVYNIETAYDHAVELERAAEELGEIVAALRARLIQADVRIRSGEVTAVVPVIWQVNQWADANGCRPLLARSHLLMARVYRDLGDVASTLEQMVSSMEALDEDTPSRIRLTHLMKLADALDESGSRDASHERYRQAERLAATIDVERHVAVLNNLAYSEYSAGDYERAWEVVERMLTISEARGYDPDTTIMDTVSRVQVGLGHYAEGVMTAEAGIEMYDSQELTQADSLPEALLTLAIAQRHLGTTRDAERNLSTLKDAQKTLDRARAICEEHGFVRILVQIKQEQAELYAASGDYRKAFEAYKLYHAAEKDLVSMQRAARAHTRQAMFEAAEARQEAERFREQARRDPLTGLRNRRYVDEHLPGLLADAASTGGAVTVALVDLDHFKRINDTCSHDVGDQVLVAIAKMLEAVPPCDTGASGFAARMGGEEFLLVLNGMTPTAAVAKLEDLRASIAARSWQSLTGDLPVTVSIGVTASQPHSGQAELLNLADANLYTAKHKGRNRVCATSGAAPVPTPSGDRRRHRDAPLPADTR